MESARWDRLQEIFHAATDLPKPEQRTYLEEVCAGDESLLADAQALLDEDGQDSSLLNRDVAHAAQDVLDDPTSQPLSFKELGPYKIVRTIGEGGMGMVYLADRADLSSRVAVKVLRDAWISPSRRERFASEQRMLAQLNHPSIARLYDANTSPDGTPYFVMEYVEGTPLTEYCNRQALSIPQRLELFRDVCEAVLYAHEHAVIHRDLKPSNILVKADGTVRLLDFGIAKQLETLGEAAEQTLTGLRMMTPAYAAPEQMRGEPIGIHTDVYSLGVILYELLAGKLPFDLANRTPAQAEKAVTEREPEKPSVVAARRTAVQVTSGQAASLSKTAWADLDVLCLTAMHKDAQRRYRSVEALVRDINHYLKDEPLEARPDTVRYRMSKFVSRNRGAVIAASGVFAAVAGLVAFFTVRLAIARNAALAEAARAQRVEEFLQNLFQGDEATSGPASDLRVVTLLDRGAEKARMLDGAPDIQAEVNLTLGTIYEQLGKYNQADALLNTALKQSQSAFGPESAQAGECLVELGIVRADAAQLVEAETLVRRGLGMMKRNLPPDHAELGKAEYALGQVLENRGAYDQAIPVLRDAVRIQSAPNGVPADLSASLSELANIAYYQGHYDVSTTLNQQALEMDRKLYGERNPNVAQDLTNLGQIQFQWGHYADAERFDRQALDIMRSWYGKDHPETGDDMTILGKVLIAEGKLDEADIVLQPALAIVERAYGKVHPRVAYALAELGSVAEQRGKLDEAEADFRRMADIYRAVYGEKHELIGTALSDLAGVYSDRKEYAQAEQLLRQAVQMYEQTLPAEHVDIGVARIKLGTVLLQEHRYADAEAESLAGCQIVMKQTNPPPKWVQAAWTDLVAGYDATNQPRQAAKFRALLADASAQTSASAGKR